GNDLPIGVSVEWRHRDVGSARTCGEHGQGHAKQSSHFWSPSVVGCQFCKQVEYVLLEFVAIGEAAVDHALGRRADELDDLLLVGLSNSGDPCVGLLVS